MKDKKKGILILLCVLVGIIAIAFLYISQQPGGTQELLIKIGLAEPTPAPTPEPTPIPTPTPTPEPTPDPEKVALDELRVRQAEEEEFLMLVNPWNPLDVDFDPEHETLWVDWVYDIESDVRCIEPLMEMYHDCRDAGGEPFITSAFRDYWDQFGLYQNKIIRCLVEDGIPDDEAPAVAALSVAVPGTSEHELGLAFDIIDTVYTKLDEEQEKTFTQQWLMENCWKYGFILRYPNGTSDITGIIYEPWHYRYVGKIAAKEITGRGITLEEYLQLLYPENEYNSSENSERVTLEETYSAMQEKLWSNGYYG